MARGYFLSFYCWGYNYKWYIAKGVCPYEAISTQQRFAASNVWYQSLQNWQSEFLAVGVLTLLSIKLRERGSPESKPVGKRYDHETG